jgi:hypothetical protein
MYWSRRLWVNRVPRTITGPAFVRLPELVSKLLAVQGHARRVRAAEPALNALAVGALLAPEYAVALGPDIETWLHAQASATATSIPPA